MSPNFKDFESWLSEKDRSEKTVNGYQADLARFAAWFAQTNNDELTPLRLTSTDIREYRAWLLERQAKPATINRQLAAIRAYCSKWTQGTNKSAMTQREVFVQSRCKSWQSHRAPR